MSEHKAALFWERTSPDFNYTTYNRAHRLDFGHGHKMEASAAPEFLGDGDRVDPEQAFVASLSSCHMLTFLAIASKKGLIVNRYEDHAIGHLRKNEHGKFVIQEVELHPEISFEGEIPDEKTLAALHEKAHQECFIANSVKCAIRINN